MNQIRPALERGHADHGWLHSSHSFSFGSYYDPRHMGVSNLRVINDDTVAPGAGFDTHGHADMEIISYVLDGALEHKDSLGNGSVIRPGDVQRMSAGRGVQHSEFNPSASEPVHFLQIWLQPNAFGVAPSYEQKHFDPQQRRGALVLLVSPDGRHGSLSSHQDALVYGTLLNAGESVVQRVDAGRRTYVHVARGAARINQQPLSDGDGIAIDGVRDVRLEGIDEAEIMLFDLPERA